MGKAAIALSSMLVLVPLITIRAQENPQATQTGRLKTIVVARETKSDSVIAIAPSTEQKFDSKLKIHPSGSGLDDLASWLSKEEEVNGLHSKDLAPWHIVITYDQFDEDGDNVHSGTYEEYWAGDRKYKRIAKSDDLNQRITQPTKGYFDREINSGPTPCIHKFSRRLLTRSSTLRL